MWISRQLPFVDLPQHLHLISVLHRLGDPTTLYPETFSSRGTLTPYLGYYHLVSLLHWLLPLELANRLYLSVYVAGMAGGAAFLLRSLRRPAWPALLCLPFAYGDSLAWGFINYVSALPLTFLALGLFVRALTDAERRLRWALFLSVATSAVLLFHVQAFVFIGLGMPWLLLTTSVPEDAGGWTLRERLKARGAAVVGVLPGAALFLVWVGGRMGEPTEVAQGAPWKAWGPMLSAQNLSFKGFAQNCAEFPDVLANMLRDGSDRWGISLALGVAGAAWGVGQLERWRGGIAASRTAGSEGPVERFRLLGLGLIALALYFVLPFDIRGYIYYLNTRYAHLAAPLLLMAFTLPLSERSERGFRWAAALVPWAVAVPLCLGFRAFDREAAPLRQVARRAGARPRVMGLIFDATSRVVRHPVYLHAAALIAREGGGLANFSFALTPHSPLKYRGDPPPTFPSEWQPGAFRWNEHGWGYDHFLVRGVDPRRVFGPLLSSELEIAAQSHDWTLVRRR